MPKTQETFSENGKGGRRGDLKGTVDRTVKSLVCQTTKWESLSKTNKRQDLGFFNLGVR